MGLSAAQEITTPKYPEWPLAADCNGWFILAKLEERGLSPVGDAPRATWLRRVYFDLTGLPPTPKDIQVLVSDSRPDAYAIAVASSSRREVLENVGGYWLDVARFGESVKLRGFIFKEAWRYRDYVIESFNNDVSFDRFVKEQVSGDLIPTELSRA